MFPIDKRFRVKPWEEDTQTEEKEKESVTKVMSVVNVADNSTFNVS